MREVLKDSFDVEFKNIEKDFRDASFFAIDCEFSGLVLKEKLSSSDKIEHQYFLKQKGMEKFSILQMGITAFHFSTVTNTYIPNVYCFNIFPQSFGEIDIDFICKTSSIEFLRQYNFDFNKLLYHGIPYLSHEEEKHVRSSLTSMDLREVLKQNLSIEEKSKIQEVCSEISEWIASNKTLSIKGLELDVNKESINQVSEQPILSEKSNGEENNCEIKIKEDSNSEGSLKNFTLNGEKEKPENNSKFGINIETESLGRKPRRNLHREFNPEMSQCSDLNLDNQLKAHETEDEVNYNCSLRTLEGKDQLIRTIKGGRLEDKDSKTLSDKSMFQNEPKNEANYGDAIRSLELDGIKENRDKLYIEDLSPIQAYITCHEICQRFPQVIVYPENNRMRVEMRTQTAEPLESAHSFQKIFEEKLMNSLKGFSRIIDLLSELKKPIIGHNMFSDLLMISKQFHGKLPPDYEDFKKVVHDQFPVLYDTKFLSYELRRRFRKTFKEQKPWKTSSLEGLYVYFKELPRDNTVFYSPNILPCDGYNDADFASGRYHNAAWDSYCAGYIFIKIVHLLATLTEEKKSDVRMLSCEEHFSIVKQYCNHVNIIQGNIQYTVLDSGDPAVSNEHFILVVQARKNCELDIRKVSELCSRHGRVKISPSGKFRAFVAMDRTGTYLGIMRHLRKHPDFQIALYSPLQHNIYIRSALWSTLIASVIGSGYLFYKAVIE